MSYNVESWNNTFEPLYITSEMQRSGKFMDRPGTVIEFSGRSGPVPTTHLKPWTGPNRSYF